MPKYHKYEWCGFDVKVKPAGVRRFLPRFVPYFTGNRPQINIVIKAKKGETRPLEANLQIKEPDGLTKESWDKFSAPNKPAKDIDKTWSLHPIALSGDHRLQLQLILPRAKDRPSVVYDLVTFTAISGDWVTVSIVLAALTIAGGVIGSIITRFIWVEPS